MRKVFLKLSILILGSLFFVNCGSRDRELQGSVFVVTKGAQNIKLGLIKVTAIPESDINQFVEQKKNIISSESNRSKSELELIKPEIEKYKNEYEEAKKNYDSIVAQRNTLKSKEQSLSLDLNPYTLYESPYLSEYETPEEKAERYKQRQIQKQIDSLKKQIAGYESKVSQANKAMSDAQKRFDDSKAKLSKITEKILSYLNESFLMDGLPEGKTKAVTDAEGKFSMRLPPGKYALVATAQRRVFYTTEEYYWLVWIDLSAAEVKQIMLSNQNMIGQDSEDSVFKYSELAPLIDNPNKDPNNPKLEV